MEGNIPALVAIFRVEKRGKQGQPRKIEAAARALKRKCIQRQTAVSGVEKLSQCGRILRRWRLRDKRCKRPRSGEKRV